MKKLVRIFLYDDGSNESLFIFDESQKVFEILEEWNGSRHPDNNKKTLVDFLESKGLNILDPITTSIVVNNY
jgi:hypothetical protein